MAWAPLFELDSGNRSESQQAELISEQEFRNKLLSVMGNVCDELRLMNARIEEAFETHIEDTDI